MTKRPALILSFACAMFAAFALVGPTQAHVGNQPHYTGRYNEASNLNFAHDADIPQIVKDKVVHVDNKLSWPPNLHNRGCGNPGQCIQVHKVVCNAPCSSSVRMFYHPGPDDLRITLKPGATIGPYIACGSIAYALGGHAHRAPGCLAVQDGDARGSLTTSESGALNQAYCDRCRVGEDLGDGFEGVGEEYVFLDAG